jgi:PPP family 3-phenylpropionic acid transporter
LYAVIGYGFTGVLGAMGGAAISTRMGLQSVFWAAMPISLLGLLCAFMLRRAAMHHPHKPATA